MSNVLRELFVKIGMVGAKDAIEQEKELGKSADKTTKKMKEQKEGAKGLGNQLVRLGKDVSDIGLILRTMLVGKALNLGFGLAHSAVNTLSSSIERSIKEASDAEQGLTNLATALSITGEFSESAMQEMQDFAAQMQKTTTASDDLVISLLAQVKAYGATNAQAKKIVETGIDFASATGKSIPEAVIAVTQSLSGMTREIQRYVPEIKNLTDEQLAAGAAVDLLAKRFSGAALKNLNTYAGAAAQLSNAWGDIFENIGAPVAKALIPIFKDLTSTINKLLPDFTKFGEKVAESFLIVREAFFGAFDLGGETKNVLGKLGQFLIDMALLVEDFFFFLRGEPSFLGKLTGATNIAELIGVGLGNALAKIPGILIDVLKGAIPPIFDAIRGFIGSMLANVVEAVTIDLPAFIIKAVIKAMKASFPLLDKVVGAFGGLPGVGLEQIADELPSDHSVETPFRKFGMTPEGFEKWSKENEHRKPFIPTDENQSRVSVARVDNEFGGLQKLNGYIEQLAQSQNMATSQFSNTVSKESRAKAEAVMPGDNTIHRNDQRTYENNLDVKINTTQPALSIQTQLNSLFLSQQTAGGN